MKTAALGLLLLCHGCLFQEAAVEESAVEETRITLENEGWELVGDLLLPASEEPLPAVLMLNKAAGDRTVYKELALQLAARGIASLRLDLRGHGESINLGRFVPSVPDEPPNPLIWDAEVDVIAAHHYLTSHARIDGDRIGMVGGSYSGEEAAEAGRVDGYAQGYVMLSPGSFSDESIEGIDASGVPWLFITSKNERHLKEITASVQARSERVELVIIPGTEHATRILDAHPDMAERIAVWLAQRL